MKKINYVIIILLFSLSINETAKAQNSTKSPQFIESIEIETLGGKKSELSYSDLVKSAGAMDNINHEKFSNSIENCIWLQFKFSQLLDAEVESINHYGLYRFIDDWMGVPYQYGGSDRNGIDCSSFAGELVREVYGVNLPRSSAEQYSVCEKLSKEQLVTGDLVFFKTGRHVSHVGVYLMNDYFVHSSTSEGVMISRLDEKYYHKRFMGGGRLSGSLGSR